MSDVKASRLISLALRHKPLALEIDAGAMVLAGFTFYCSENGVWLTDRVPPHNLRASEEE